jgi:hypothetical protein
MTYLEIACVAACIVAAFALVRSLQALPAIIGWIAG